MGKGSDLSNEEKKKIDALVLMRLSPQKVFDNINTAVRNYLKTLKRVYRAETAWQTPKFFSSFCSLGRHRRSTPGVT